MQSDGVIERYAIGGAVGATFYLEPVATLDVDIFVTFKPEAGSAIVDPQPIYDYLKARGGAVQGEHVVIAGWPVQFLPPGSPLVEEALAEAVDAGRRRHAGARLHRRTPRRHRAADRSREGQGPAAPIRRGGRVRCCPISGHRRPPWSVGPLAAVRAAVSPRPAMTFDLERVLARASARCAGNWPPSRSAEKLRMLDAMRERALALRHSARVADEVCEPRRRSGQTPEGKVCRNPLGQVQMPCSPTAVRRLDLRPARLDHFAFIPSRVSTLGARPPQRGLCFFPKLNEVPAA